MIFDITPMTSKQKAPIAGAFVTFLNAVGIMRDILSINYWKDKITFQMNWFQKNDSDN
jgi:hypothetical protein